MLHLPIAVGIKGRLYDFFLHFRLLCRLFFQLFLRRNRNLCRIFLEDLIHDRPQRAETKTGEYSEHQPKACHPKDASSHRALLLLYRLLYERILLAILFFRISFIYLFPGLLFLPGIFILFHRRTLLLLITNHSFDATIG